MKSKTLTLIAIAALGPLVLPSNLPAHQQHHYKLIDLGTFGGPNSSVTDTGVVPGGVFLNNSGVLTGYADLSAPDPFPNFCFIDCFIDHAFRWDGGFMADLGVLPHGWTSAPVAISANGLIAGFAVNGQIDPLIPGFPEQRAVLWKDGRLFDLGTLPEGGYESEASSVNSRGEVVGTAFNTILDPVGLNVFNDIFSPTQARAFLWQDGAMQDLGTLGGNDAAAFLINEKGQVMGWSLTSTTTPGGCYPLALGSFLWDHEHGMRNLGDFGGACTKAYDLNNRGQVVGGSWLESGASRGFLWQDGSMLDLGGAPGGSTIAFVINEAGQAAGVGSALETGFFHALFWPKVGEAIDLGTIGTDPCSSAKAINNKGQIVGDSISLANCTTSFDASRAFLWQDGATFDLNALIPPGSPLYLVHPQTINDRGEIAGFGVDADGNQHVFLLVPCDEEHANIDGCDYGLVDAAEATLLSPAPLIQMTGLANRRKPAGQMFGGRLAAGRFPW